VVRQVARWDALGRPKMWLRQAACGAPQSTEISGVESDEDQGLLCQQKTGCLSASTIRKQQPHQVGGQLEDSIVTEGVKDPQVSRVGTKEWKSWLAVLQHNYVSCFSPLIMQHLLD